MTERTYKALVDAHIAVARLNVFLSCEDRDYRPNEEVQAMFLKLHTMWEAADRAWHPEHWIETDEDDEEEDE